MSTFIKMVMETLAEVPMQGPFAENMREEINIAM
jgi:hypothetical protein